MADIRCSKCGKDNPDFLDVCQFCQTPLTPEPRLHIGEKPTKKNTGELEPILPQWLQDVRQQGRDSAEEDAVQAATQPKVQKNEAPDLLAGLASQNDDDEDDVPDWLASINPVVKPKPSELSSPEPSNDFFAQFGKSEAAPVKSQPTLEEPAQEETPAWMSGSAQPQVPAEKDELSAWLSNASETPAEPFAFQSGASQDDSDWLRKLGSPEPASKETPVPEEKEDLGWLHTLEASAKQADTSSPKQDAAWNFDAPGTTPSSSAPQEDLSWLNNLGGSSGPAQPAQQDDLSWLNDLGKTSEPASSAFTPSASSQEDLGWLNNLGGISEPEKQTPVTPAPQDDLGWLNALGGTSEPAQQPPAPASSQDDLSWLNEFAEPSKPAKQPSVSSSSQDDLSWLKDFGETSELAASEPIQASASDDLGWLKTFGGTPESAPAEPAQAPASDDLSWLKNFGGTSEPSQPEPVQPSAQDDLGWLKDFAATSEPAQETPVQSQGLDWLDNLGAAPEPSQPSISSQGDFDWLANLGEVSESSASAKPFGSTDELALPKNFEDEQNAPHISPFVPRRTAPLSEDAIDNMPDWLKSATEEMPILPLGASALDYLREPSYKIPDKATPISQPEPASAESTVFSSSSESQSLSNQEVDSLFSMDMPDWVSRSQPGASESTPPGMGTPQPVADESLSPVDLPSWVQAMRPVESVLSETGTPGTENQPTEKEGPLAGLRGVIPFAPIGSSRRPKAFSLKLQATDEQQASAALLDQILAGETAPRAVASSASLFMPQRVLRWTLTGLFMIVLGVIIAMRSQIMPISAALPLDVSAVSNAVATIPDNASVLVVVDYEPSLAGEMEAVSGPLLDQIALARQSHLVFLSTSPNSSALVERLMTNTKINKPVPDGLGYVAGEQYFNLGYLPGGSAGILGFVSNPGMVIPSAGVQSISEYAAVVVLTDNAESGRAWVEQLDAMKQVDPSLATHPLILVTSAQAGPMLQPYVSSKQVAGMINGLSDAARFEFVNNSRPGIARSYWDAFGVGMMMAVALIIFGGVWSLITGIRARRANGEEG